MDTELKETDLEPYYDTVKKYARVAFKKMRKPSIYLLEDVENEGMMVLCESIKLFKPEYQTTFKTFLIRCLINHFCTYIVTNPYKKHVYDSVDVEYINCRPSLTTLSSEDIAQVSGILDQLTGIENKYLKFMLTPPNCIIELIQQIEDGRKRNLVQRLLTCDWLHITEEKERQIRNSIKTRLTSRS